MLIRLGFSHGGITFFAFCGISFRFHSNAYFSSGLHFEKLTLGKIQYYIDRGLLNPSKITMFDLVSNNLVNIPDDHYGVELSIQVKIITANHCYI